MHSHSFITQGRSAPFFSSYIFISISCSKLILQNTSNTHTTTKLLTLVFKLFALCSYLCGFVFINGFNCNLCDVVGMGDRKNVGSLCYCSDGDIYCMVQIVTRCKSIGGIVLGFGSAFYRIRIFCNACYIIDSIIYFWWLFLIKCSAYQ